MMEVFPRPEHVPTWHEAALGGRPDWQKFLSEYVAAVDWPASAYWEQLSHAYPNALILLSTRRDGETWFKSASSTIFPSMLKAEDSPWRRMVMDMMKHQFIENVEDKAAAIAAYEAHNAYVRKNAAPNRLIEWQAEQGWGPLCAALKVPIPDQAFPHSNSTEEFKNREKEREASLK
ncbi:MAG: hypothetical protein ACI915_002649 [Gammaproteobacteria bacterium]|jgi:hypothetical protein